MSSAAELRGIEQALADQLQDLAPSAAGRWLVGFSGGLDSTVLLHLLHNHVCKMRVAPTLVALHVNHGMQSDAAQWQAHCHRTCDDMGVPFVAETVVVAATASPEAAARDARYRAFSRHLAPGDALFLAHHRDDQVETLFMRLLRGSGPSGLAGMPRMRPLGAGTLFRPLLELTRESLHAYGERAELRWLDDPSNNDNQLDRNFIRNQVLPLVASRWPGYRQTLARAAALQRQQDSLVADLAGETEILCNRFGDRGLSLEQVSVDKPDLAAVQLRGGLRALGLAAPPRDSLAEFLRQLARAADPAGITLETGDWTLRVFDGVAWLLPLISSPPTDWSGELSAGESLELDWLGVVSLEFQEGGPLRLAPGEKLSLKLRSGGEKLQTVAGRRSVKKLLQEAKVPPWWRGRLPLLYRNEKLLAIADITAVQASAAGNGVACRLCWSTPNPIEPGEGFC